MFDTDNRLLTMIKQSQIPLGMQCFTGDRALIEVLGIGAAGPRAALLR
jgi:2-dehydro-3-deoxyglucarate aldolase/4-hydroxy-2-oxoheptanedioate aldolase